MKTNQIGRIQNNFDSLRLIFATLVIFSHSFPLTRGTNGTEPLFRLTGSQITFGNISVWAFFTISGFLITQSWMRSPSPWRFLKRRIARIYPGYIVLGLVSGLIIVPSLPRLPATYVPISLPSFFWQTLQLQTAALPPIFAHNRHPNILNGSLWSIAYEFWCYLGVIFLGLTTALRRRATVIVIFVIVMAYHMFLTVRHLAFSGGILGRIFGFPPFWGVVLPFFLAGMLFHLYGGRSLLRTRWLLAALVVLVASRFVPYGLDVTLPICGSYLLMWLAYWPALHPLHLGRFGDFSYGTYLYAFPIQQLLIMHFSPAIGPWRLFALAAPLTLCAGALSWFLVEKHFLPRRTELKLEGQSLNVIRTSHAPVEQEAALPVHAGVES